MQRGYSFIELIVIVSIIGIVAAMAAPRLGDSIALRELEDAAQQVATDIRWTQQEVVNRGGLTVTPTITFFDSQYCIEAGLGKLLKPRVVLPESVRFTMKPVLTFRLDGTLPAGATIALQSQRKRTLFRYIFVESLTGRVRVANTL